MATADLELWLRKVGRFRPVVCYHQKGFKVVNPWDMTSECVTCGKIMSEVEIQMLRLR